MEGRAYREKGTWDLDGGFFLVSMVLLAWISVRKFESVHDFGKVMQKVSEECFVHLEMIRIRNLKSDFLHTI